MSTLQERGAPATAPPPAAWTFRHAARLLAAALAIAVALGVAARLYSPSALWLDEALSVAIARRPLPELFDALRRDGSPPLYYLLLHGWTIVFGTSDVAVRALSTVFSLATLPLVWRAGRALGGPLVGASALLVLAVNPFAVRYATEARMYALVQLLVTAGLLAVLRALDRPSLARLAPVGLLSGLLALTHYWALFLLACAAGVLLALARRSPDRRPAALRTLAALVSGGVLFLPWLPTFLFQVQRTGTPWAPTPGFVDAYYTVTGWSGGGGGLGVVLTLLLLGLGGLALVGRRAHGGIVLRRPVDPVALALLAVSAGTLVLGLLAGMLLSAGYAARYSSVALVPGLLLAALGLRALPPRPRAVVLALAAVTGLAGALPQPLSTKRTQAVVTAATLAVRLQPGDTVVYCPDQLGPAVSRLLPPGTKQVVYPSFGSPELVDWVDYAERNAAASPQAYAQDLDQRAPGVVWLVVSGGYRTFGRQCEQLAEALEERRGEGRVVQNARRGYGEQQAVTRFGPLVSAGR
ncbi:MAG: glycosyltransferase family 39 protein [Actinomycetota bacterium]|nr:glycosyltransferase family 39 protein [Actinomycetota bacterium]